MTGFRAGRRSPRNASWRTAPYASGSPRSFTAPCAPGEVLIGMGGSVGTTPVTEWSITLNNDTQDVTDTGSAGWQAMLAGVSSAETTFTAFF